MSGDIQEESPLLDHDSEDEYLIRHHLDFGADDERNPRAWSRPKKLFNVFIVALMSILSPLASSIFMPGIADIAADLGSSQAKVIGTTTGFVIMLGIGPLLHAPLSEAFGRKIVYISCFSIFTLLQIPTALAPNIGVLITVRTFSGFFGSVGIANGGGTINDMFAPEERASVYGWYLLGPMLGPVLGPLLGGFIVQRLGWRWNYWILTMICSFTTLVGMIFLSESYAPILLACEKEKLEQQCGNHARRMYFYEGQDERPLIELVVMALQRPLRIFHQPIVIVLSCYQAVVFSTTYTIYTQIPAIFSQYGFNTEQIGLLYLPVGLGSFTSVFLLVPQIDVVYNKLAARNNGVAHPEYRLPLANIGGVLVPISLFWFGWTVYYRLPWLIPMSALYVYGIGQVMVMNTAQNYLIDAFPRYAASSIAAGSVLRSLFAGLTPLLASQMFQDIGYGWGTSVFAFVAVLAAPSPVLLYIYARQLRDRFPINL